MMIHTKEPWIVRKDGLPEMNNQNNLIEGGQCVLVAYGQMTDADARRIVACVNACAGLDSDLLENIAITGGLVERFSLLNQTEQQRDELLAVAKNLRDVKGRYHSEQAMTKLLGVIIQIEGAV